MTKTIVRIVFANVSQVKKKNEYICNVNSNVFQKILLLFFNAVNVNIMHQQNSVKMRDDFKI